MKKRGITILAASGDSIVVGAVTCTYRARHRAELRPSPFAFWRRTIDDIHGAYKSGAAHIAPTGPDVSRSHQRAYDKRGPSLNAIITVNS